VSLLGICDLNTYEGEAAILLENYVTDYNLDNCSLYCSVLKDGTISTKDMLYRIFLDYNSGNSKEKIIINFFYTLASIIFQTAKKYQYKKIAFSGGVFQNSILIDMIKELGEVKYKLYFNINLAPNDENISYGQIMYYLHCK
jgi:hydrogenase maturation protein HypF